MSLARALAAARSGAYGEVLAALIAVWGEQRADELATVIELASTIAARDRPPISGGSQRALHATWLAVDAAGDPADVPRLLATLGNGNLTHATERIARLSRRPPDPRIAAGLEAVIAAPPSVAFVKSASVKFWDAVCAELARIADPRTRTIHERLAWLADDRAASPFDAGPKRMRNTKAIAKVVFAMAPAAPPPPPAGLDELAAILRAVPVPVDRGAALLAKIYDDPHDLDARAVYADWLTEQGDPRGELIALQLARGVPHDDLATQWREVKPSTRERALLRTHQSVWAGALGSLLSEIRFERGFPHRGRVAPNIDLSALAIPAMSTLAHLSMYRSRPENPRQLTQRPFHGLVSLTGIDWHTFATIAVAEPPPAIRSVGVYDNDALPLRYGGFASTWRLERLELHTGGYQPPAPGDAQVHAFMSTPLVQRLHALQVAYAIRNDRAFIAGFVDSKIRHLELASWSHRFELALERDARTVRLRIAVHYNPHPANRVSTVPLLRERAATWPRELVDVAILEIGADYDREPDERAQIVAVVRELAGDLEVSPAS